MFSSISFTWSKNSSSSGTTCGQLIRPEADWPAVAGGSAALEQELEVSGPFLADSIDEGGGGDFSSQSVYLLA